ncbi:MAG: tRNA (N(6)-L-threonylcarbamoyladenosine(37)-C(2))-methylthiotransferase [Thermoplasmata archaeon]
MKVFVEAYGCTLNQGDGRWIARRLSEAGHRIVEGPDGADACVLVTCTVIETTERRMLKRMRQLAGKDRRLVVAGCMASVQTDVIKEAVPSADVVPPTQMDRIADLLPSAADAEYECFEPRSTVDGIIPIAQGCLASCTYCISTVARGPLRSYPPEEVVAEVSNALKRGRLEIRLTSLDTGQYGRDLGINLAVLLGQVCQAEGSFRVRVGMMSPMMLRPIIDDLLEAYKQEKLFKFLHLPVQSGDDEVLRRMKRGYTVEQFWDVIEAFRREINPLTLATDIIVGFPGEGEEEFENTLELVRELRPDILNITRFSPRPGTPAAAIEGQVPSWVMKERSRELTKLRFEIGRETHRRLIGSSLRVLTTEEGKWETTLARSDAYRPVVLPGRWPLGEFLDVRVEGSTETYLQGRPLRGVAAQAPQATGTAPSP